jgi:pimeloyl-ACP methyl ester carboxylesterase
LGSASSLELASRHQDRLDGLIVESGFAYAGPLLELLGVNLLALGFVEEAGFRQIDKIRQWTKPLLIIHAEFDHIIPFAEGQALYEACPSAEKTLLKVATPTTTISCRWATPPIWRQWPAWVSWPNGRRQSNPASLNFKTPVKTTHKILGER